MDNFHSPVARSELPTLLVNYPNSLAGHSSRRNAMCIVIKPIEHTPKKKTKAMSLPLKNRSMNKNITRSIASSYRDITNVDENNSVYDYTIIDYERLNRLISISCQ